ncbi:uncharacterized protein [Dysidea avara]|uniref:uncharacterized protein isoform X2 n=1 Tax=Dysidea avara TaxID=196820 RepID=UPI0033317FCC
MYMYKFISKARSKTDSCSWLRCTSAMAEGVVLLVNLLLLLSTSALGAEYYLGFIAHFTHNPSVVLITMETQPVQYLIEAPEAGYCANGTIIPNSQHSIKLPGNLIGKSNTFPSRFDVVPKGIYLKTSSDSVMVIGQSTATHTTDTFLAVPTKDLCHKKYVYYPVSVSTYVRADGSVAIVGTEDNTVVNITVSTSSNINLNSTSGWRRLTRRTQYSYVINRLQTVYLAAYIRDLTGTKIEADKPLSVFSGHECAFIPFTTYSCDHLLEQVLPTALWGTVYYVAPLATRRSYTIKVIAASRHTNVQIYCNGTQSNYTIGVGQFITNAYRNQEYCAFVSNKKISVTQFSHGTAEDGLGDPMMTLVPAITDYSSRIISSTIHDPIHPSYREFINVVVLADYFQPTLMYLNVGGKNQSMESFSWTPITVDNSTEAYAALVPLNIVEGIFEIVHTNKAAMMSAVVYGFYVDPVARSERYNREGYGHPAGFNILQKYLKYDGHCGTKNGNRVSIASDFMCHCTPNVHNNCTPEIEYCSPNPCLNNGTCIDRNDEFTCICPSGFTGDNCGININDCLPNPCENNGSCTDLVNDYACNCAVGYRGRNCTIIDRCAPNPCQNNGKCLNLANDYICNCTTGYAGKRCTDKVVNDHCSPSPCQNNGTCCNIDDGYLCTCIAGFTGTDCNTDVNDCVPNPCRNEGICVDLIGGYECKCADGYSGLNCEVSVKNDNGCYLNPCQNEGTCITHGDNYTCLCVDDFTGRDCDLKSPGKSAATGNIDGDDDDKFIPGFFVGLTCGIICLVITLMIIWMYKKFYKSKSSNGSATGGGEKTQEKLDSSVMFEEQLEMSSKDNATLVTNDFTDH